MHRLAGMACLVVIFNLLNTNYLMAQSAEEVLQDLMKKYATSDQFTADLEIGIYASDDAQKPQIVRQSMIRKNGSQHYVKTGEVEMLYKDDLVLTVDHRSGMMHYQKREKIKKPKAFDWPDPQETLSHADSVVVGRTDQNNLYLVIYDADAPIQQSYWYLNAEGWISQVHYFYNEELFPQTPKVVLSYTNMSNTPRFSKSLFAASTYVQKSGKTFIPKAPYSNYQITVSND